MASPLTPLTTGPRRLAALALPAPAGTWLARPAAAVALGLALTLGQLLAVCLLSGHADPVTAYRSLFEWDSTWYCHIAEHGYPEAIPDFPPDMAKLGFFPGYPLLSRVVARLAGLTASDGLLVAAQLACWGFWTYVFLFVRRWGTPVPVALLGLLAVVAHPCAFFLVAGYSESLFLLGVLGFLYWSGVRGPAAWCLAALHGVVMTGTRIVGLPLAVCPVVMVAVALWGDPRLATRDRFRGLVRPASLCAAAMLGGLLFFGFCQLQYGHWDAYMLAQRVGWGVTPDYLALFKLDVYRFALPTSPDLNPNYLSRVCVPVTVVLFCALFLVECRVARADREGTWRQRLGFYLAGGLMFYIAVSGLANSGLISMIRYTFCVHVMLALAVTHLLARVPPPGGPGAGPRRRRPARGGGVFPNFGDRARSSLYPRRVGGVTPEKGTGTSNEECATMGAESVVIIGAGRPG
jgi:hypothetical protein